MSMEENRLSPHAVPTRNNTTRRNPSTSASSSSQIPSISSLSLLEPPQPNIKSCISSSTNKENNNNNNNNINGDDDKGKGKVVEVMQPHDDNKNKNKKKKNSNGGRGEEEEGEEEEEVTGRERLKRHREEVKGNVKIPERWGQEKLLQDWIDYTTFDALLAPRHRLIVAARDALVADARKAVAPSSSRSSQRLRIHI